MEPNEVQLERERLAAQQAKDAAAHRSQSGLAATDQRVKLADADFSRWQGAAEAQRKWLETLAECRVKAAQAELTEAQAEYQRAKTVEKLTIVRAKMMLVDRMERDFKRLREQEYQHDRDMRRWRERIQSANNVRNLPSLSPESVALVWVAWRFFLARCPVETAKALAESGAVEFVESLRRERRRPEVGSPEHIRLIEAFGQLATSADAIRDAAEAHIAAIRAGTFDLWKPIQLLSAPGED